MHDIIFEDKINKVTLGKNIPPIILNYYILLHLCFMELFNHLSLIMLFIIKIYFGLFFVHLTYDMQYL